jgi:lysophospholipase L1-like esterase
MSKLLVPWIALMSLAVPTQSVLAQPETPLVRPKLPKILLLGDSIRMGYAPIVVKKLQGIAEVVHPEKTNGADTPTTLKNLDAWLAQYQPDLVHWNNGLHDLKFSKKSQTHQVPLDEYAKNLAEIAKKLSQATKGKVIFVTTTPIIDDRHAQRGADFDRFDRDVRLFNDKALSVMHPLGIPVHDLNAIVQHYGPDKLMAKDGTHYSPAGSEILATAVADCLQRHLAIHASKLTLPADPKPEATEQYKKAEAEQDALVPEVYKKLKVPDFPLPMSAEEWQKQRGGIKEKVLASLGDMPARPKTPLKTLVSVERHPAFTLERMRLGNGLDGEMSCMMLIPQNLKAKAPTILWLHSSSYTHLHLLQPNSNGGEEPLGLTLVKKGYVVFAPDAAWYGDRAGQGPAGAKETGANQQTSQHKLHLWLGRTLWGMFVRDDQVALDYLCSRPEVDTSRIGATGISMGSTRSWWLAAVDDRISAGVGVACLTRYENLIHHGQLRQHGVYYFVFGLLKHFDVEGVLSLIAPRPFLFLTGELDAGSPADGIKILEDRVGRVYATLKKPEAFRSIRYEHTGHVYTPKMRQEMLAWFDRWLKTK